MPNIFPTESTTTTQARNQQVKFGKGWRFDFEAGEFVLTPTGKVAPANELEAYMQWCEKALRTPRYRHMIYSRNYGSEFDDLIGRGYPKAIVESEITRIVTETLMTDPRTGSIQNSSFSWGNDGVYFSCDVYTINTEIVSTGLKVVV